VLKSILQDAVRYDKRWLPLCLLLYKYKRDRKLLKLMPFKNISQSPVHEKSVLQPGYMGRSYGPKSFSTGHQKIAEVQHPDLYFRVFLDARVSAHSSSVVSRDDEIYVEMIPGGERDVDYRGGHILMHGPCSAIVKAGEPECLEKGIFLAGNGSYNYYHWLVEISAKSQLLGDLPDDYTDYPIFVSQKVRDIPSFTNILNALIKDRDVIYMDPRQSYRVGSLVWIDTPNLLPFNMVGDQPLRAVDCYTRKKSIEYLRSRLLVEMEECAGETKAERVFLARKPGSRDYNQDEVEMLLSRYGFATVYMENLDYREQVETIRAAKYIIGPTGAAWTNLIYANKGTCCLCWMAEEYGDFAAFSNIANIVSADMTYLRGQCGEKVVSQIYKASYRIDLDEVEAFLKKHVSAVV